VAAVTGGRLILHADSAAWATRIRYLAATLTTSLKDQHGCQWLRDIHVKVRPASAPHIEKVTPPPHQPPRGGAQSVADGACESPPQDIQQALDRLARHGPKP